jgi:MerR family transcriptional regulator, thiopeptide resistance regulator
VAQGSGDDGRRVGELAAATGLTVRTLHYYEEIGLLVASGRTEAGHRLYADDDVERLYRICLLRRIGLSLDEIGRALDDPAWDLRAAMGSQLRDLDRRLEAGGRLRGRVAQILATIEESEAPRTEELLAALEEMTSLDPTVQRRISILVYADLPAAFDYLVRVFGLGPGELTRDEQGNAVHGELQAGDGVVWLHPEQAEFGLASPRTLGAVTASVAVMVDDVDAHHRHAVAEGARVDYEPMDQPYGYREYGARDCEGGLWAFMKPID